MMYRGVETLLTGGEEKGNGVVDLGIGESDAGEDVWECWCGDGLLENGNGVVDRCDENDSSVGIGGVCLGGGELIGFRF